MPYKYSMKKCARGGGGGKGDGSWGGGKLGKSMSRNAWKRKSSQQLHSSTYHTQNISKLELYIQRGIYTQRLIYTHGFQHVLYTDMP